MASSERLGTLSHFGADLLLIDEAAGREEARRRNLPVTGTLGVLRAVAEQVS
jgi:predicted nucleic acid-binding protein